MLQQYARKQRGFSLVELMISVAIGLVVLAVVLQIYVSTVNSSGDTLKMARVNQELRAAMDVMVRDIQRAGYYFWTTDRDGKVDKISNPNPFMQGANDLTINGSCIAYTYDRTPNRDVADKTVYATEKFAFYLSGNAILMRNGGSESSDSCTPNSEGITDKNRVTITGLSFSLTAHCINASAPPNADNCTSLAPTDGNVLIKPRQVTITITGKPKGDSSGEMQRTITNTVHLRNHLVCTAPC